MIKQITTAERAKISWQSLVLLMFKTDIVAIASSLGPRLQVRPRMLDVNELETEKSKFHRNRQVKLLMTRDRAEDGCRLCSCSHGHTRGFHAISGTRAEHEPISSIPPGFPSESLQAFMIGRKGVAAVGSSRPVMMILRYVGLSKFYQQGIRRYGLGGWPWP
jgi:hypothetical protein